MEAHSLKTVADAVVPLMPDGGSSIGLDFDATVAWPAPRWSCSRTCSPRRRARSSTSTVGRPVRSHGSDRVVIDHADLVGTDQFTLVVVCFAILNAYPYGTGHLLVMPYREVPALEDLSAEESQDLWRMVNDAVVAIKVAYRTGGVNVGFNLGSAGGAGVPTHLHGHVLPRWGADSNFLTTVAEARVLPGPLSATWEKRSSAWPS